MIINVGDFKQESAQLEILQVAKVYKSFHKEFKLYLFAHAADASYMYELEDFINSYGLQNNVFLKLKPSDETLKNAYKNASIYLSLNKQETPDVHLTQALYYNLACLSPTLEPIPLKEKSSKEIAATLELLRKNRVLKRELQNIQKKTQSDIYIPPIRYQFEGPFDSSYSLAILNRESALAFEEKFPKKIALFSTEGGGDFTPNQEFLEQNPLVKELHQRADKQEKPSVVLRNLYPPRVDQMHGQINILNAYGWEESTFPQEYVNDFNKNLDGITVMSHYVKKVLQDNGVSIPIAVVGLGVEHILKTKAKPIKLKTKKSFKFLHISSAFARKGVDVLLQAYIAAFTASDDVTLIIKTFPNPHNDLASQIQEIQKDSNAPEIILINEDLSQEYIVWLYENSHALVAPSKGEGFGLPMAEAMLFELPVITTGYSGQVDFCTKQTAWLIEYEFTKAQTHMGLFNSYWAEPSLSSLTALLKEQLTLTQAQKEQKTKKAKALILQEFTWQNYVQKTSNFLEELKNKEIFKKTTQLAWISSFNTKCGIATYSEFLLQHFDKELFHIHIYANLTKKALQTYKEKDVLRCWNNRTDENLNELTQKVISSKTDHALINFNFGFFSMPNLEKMILAFHKENIEVSIIFHSVQDVTIQGSESSLGWIKQTLKDVKNLFVHNINDCNILKSFSLEKNVTLLPHGVQKQKRLPLPKEDTFTLASYGFLLPHKGIVEIIEAFALLHTTNKNIRLKLINALYPDPVSQEYFQVCKKSIQKHSLEEHIEFITEFLSDADSLMHLNQADLLLMPYINTQESASGAVRYTLSTMKPVLCTPLKIFDDVADIVHFTQDNTPQNLAKNIENLMQNSELLTTNKTLQQKWVNAHEWSFIAQKLTSIILAPKV